MGARVEARKSAVELHDGLELQDADSFLSALESAGGDTSERKKEDIWRKWLWRLLVAALILQTYYVREMLAALAVFTILFIVVALVAGIVYVLGRSGEITISLAEPLARRGIALAEDFSKRASRRPRSAPAP
ncbi:MAG TPA: hypothetical protein VN862_00485 [Candidatus Acidoferrales bacterium]|jgi:hypothetical protein|nr:hypothetical protein [Candidatus Acidoferrales bacterium]